ncbi:MAG: diaminopimelate epimerase [Deltaproteobacteria bacterium]|nr:diaminopimelate epimerase [Deltaproteobacteria bacterium]
MEGIEFWKMNGTGNDFIIIDNRRGLIHENDMGYFVKRACRRRESIGADGVIFVLKSRDYDFRWRYFNADGGEAEMCGNGGRCVSRFAFLKGIAGSKMVSETMAGHIPAEVNGRIVKILMPPARGFARDLKIEHKKGWKSIDFINTGVPHAVVQVEELADYPVKEHGSFIRHHSLLSPQGANANFMKINAPGQLEIRTYERGVEDETLACGTGSIACALVSSLRGMTDSPVKVRTRSGEDLTIYFKRNKDFEGGFEEIWLEGNTSFIYQGQLNREAL